MISTDYRDCHGFNAYDKYGLLIPLSFRLSYSPDITGESRRRLDADCEADQARYNAELAAIRGAISRGERADVAGATWFIVHPLEEQDPDGYVYLTNEVEALRRNITVAEWIALRDAPDPEPPARTEEEMEAEWALEAEWEAQYG